MSPLIATLLVSGALQRPTYNQMEQAMSSDDQSLDSSSIKCATEILKEMLQSPASEHFFSETENESSIQKLLSSHEKIARHLSRLENESSVDPIDDFIDGPLSF